MKYVEEFRDPVAARAALAAIAATVEEIGATEADPVRIMEICGGHTHAIFRYGLDRLTPKGLEFIHGPGCPVCVLPMRRVDECIEIAERPEVIFTTFGDALKTAYGNLVGTAAAGPSCGGMGTRVVAGDTSSSILFSKISEDTPVCGSRMPLSGPPYLDADQIATFESWISAGATDD